jgi:hypothetical protein
MSAIAEWGLDTEELGMYIVTPEASVLEKPGAEMVRTTRYQSLWTWERLSVSSYEVNLVLCLFICYGQW